jgi:hypothetical protein
MGEVDEGCCSLFRAHQALTEKPLRIGRYAEGRTTVARHRPRRAIFFRLCCPAGRHRRGAGQRRRGPASVTALSGRREVHSWRRNTPAGLAFARIGEPARAAWSLAHPAASSSADAERRPHRPVDSHPDRDQRHRAGAGAGVLALAREPARLHARAVAQPRHQDPVLAMGLPAGGKIKGEALKAAGISTSALPRRAARHVLARIDKAGNFEPGNCRWATRVEDLSRRRRRPIGG